MVIFVICLAQLFNSYLVIFSIFDMQKYLYIFFCTKTEADKTVRVKQSISFIGIHCSCQNCARFSKLMPLYHFHDFVPFNSIFVVSGVCCTN